MTPITDHIAFLTEARKELEELELLKDREKQLKADESRLLKDFELEKKNLNDNINTTIKKRREEINSSYDKEIAKGQDKLKKAKAKREKAKSQGMKERIAEETADLHKENRDLKLQIKTLFQKNHVPGFCNTGWYYALFFPRWFNEFMKLLALILICFLALPYGIFLALPKHETWMLVAVYFACIVFFGGIYILVANKTKMAHTNVLKSGRALRDQMHSNKKKIRVITNSIRKDRNESVYNLEKYDDEIAQVEQELQEIANKKKEALGTFEQVTKTIISDEIANNAKPRVEKLREEYQAAEAGAKDMEKQIKDKNLHITDNYGIYLGSEFLEPLKIGELTEIIRSGRASNLTEAMEVAKKAKEES